MGNALTECVIGMTGVALFIQYRAVLRTPKKSARAQKATPRSMKKGQLRTVTSERANGRWKFTNSDLPRWRLPLLPHWAGRSVGERRRSRRAQHNDPR